VGYRKTKAFSKAVSEGIKKSEKFNEARRSLEHRERSRENRVKYNKSDEVRERSRETMIRLWADPEMRAYLSKKHSEAMKKKWKDPEYVKKQMKAINVRPNKLELLVSDQLKPYGFNYVGDGQLIVAGKCPDFWDGGKRIIELYGDYWHRGQDPQDRIDLFKRHGYNCLIIWESELEQLEQKMEGFCG